MSYIPHHPDIATPSPTASRSSTPHTFYANKRRTESSDILSGKWRRVSHPASRQGGTPDSTKTFTAEAGRHCLEILQDGASLKSKPELIPGLESRWTAAQHEDKARAQGLLHTYVSQVEQSKEKFQKAQREEFVRLSEKYKTDMSALESRDLIEERQKRRVEGLAAHHKGEMERLLVSFASRLPSLALSDVLV